MYKFFIKDPQFLPHIGSDIELSLAKGEMVAISGENGVGKTSLIHKIYDKNKSIISLVEQKPLDFFYDRRMDRIKELFLDVSGNNISREKFLNYWRMFNLHLKENRFVSSLSGGESQALKICIGLSVDREIYLLDEPSQFLDNYFKQQLSNILEQLISERKTILLVEHDFSWQKTSLTRFPLTVKDGVLVRGE